MGRKNEPGPFFGNKSEFRSNLACGDATGMSPVLGNDRNPSSLRGAGCYEDRQDTISHARAKEDCREETKSF